MKVNDLIVYDVQGGCKIGVMTADKLSIKSTKKLG
jgi:hypothetical protein